VRDSTTGGERAALRGNPLDRAPQLDLGRQQPVAGEPVFT